MELIKLMNQTTTFPMKSILLYCTVLLFLSCMGGNPNSVNSKKEISKTKGIKSEHSVVYFPIVENQVVKKGKRDFRSLHNSKTWYNELGNKVKKEKYADSNRVKSIVTYFYNEKDLKTESRKEENNKTVSTYKYYYNENDMRVKMTLKFDSEDTPRQFLSFYDSENRMVKKVFIRNGKVKSVNKYEYSGNTIKNYEFMSIGKEEYIDHESVPIEKFHLEDETEMNGDKVISNISFQSSGEVWRSRKNKYNQDGELIETKTTNGKNEIMRTMSKSISGDSYISNIENFEMNNYYKLLMEYHLDEIVKNTLYNEDGSIKRIDESQYTYDDKNNWIKRISCKDGEPVKIIEREIEYY